MTEPRPTRPPDDHAVPVVVLWSHEQLLTAVSSTLIVCVALVPIARNPIWLVAIAAGIPSGYVGLRLGARSALRKTPIEDAPDVFVLEPGWQTTARVAIGFVPFVALAVAGFFEVFCAFLACSGALVSLGGVVLDLRRTLRLRRNGLVYVRPVPPGPFRRYVYGSRPAVLYRPVARERLRVGHGAKP